MDDRRKALLDYVKGALQRGYKEEEIKKTLLDNKISWVEAASLLTVARNELGMEKDNKEAVIEKPNKRLPPLLITLAGLVAMLIAYLYRYISPETLNMEFLGPLNVAWPFVFPVISNLVNLIFFRKRFLLGFILSLVVIVVLVASIFLLAFFGI